MLVTLLTLQRWCAVELQEWNGPNISCRTSVTEKTALVLGCRPGVEGAPKEVCMHLLPVLFREGDHIADADTKHAQYPRGEAGCAVQEVCWTGQCLPLSFYLWKVNRLPGVKVGGSGTGILIPLTFFELSYPYLLSEKLFSVSYLRIESIYKEKELYK